MRKLIMTAVMALAMTALMASSASAAVEVRNGNGELCGTEATCEVTFDGQLRFNQSSYYVLNHRCSAEWAIEVSEDGSLYLKDAVIDGNYLNDYCETFNGSDEVGFCGGADSAYGYITVPGDEDYVGPGHTEPAPGFHYKHYNAVINTCWHSGYDNWQDSLGGKMRFEITDAEFPPEFPYQPPMEWAFDEQPAFTNVESYPAWVQEATLNLIGTHQLPAGELSITSVEE